MTERIYIALRRAGRWETRYADLWRESDYKGLLFHSDFHSFAADDQAHAEALLKQRLTNTNALPFDGLRLAGHENVAGVELARRLARDSGYPIEEE